MIDKGVATDSTLSQPLSQIYFYLTKGCNLRCRHCWIAPKYQAADRSHPALDFDIFRSIIEQAKPLGLKGVKLTGGEPLLHPRIADILEFVRAEGLNLVVETNGVLCTPALARQIAGCVGAHVSVSLDGADAATHEWVRGVSGSFEAAVEGLKNLAAVGLGPQVIMTLMRRNREQVEAVVRIAEKSGAGSVKFNLMQPTARGERMHEEGEALDVEELIEIGRWVEGPLASSTDLPLLYSHPTAFRPLGRMFGSDRSGCGVCGIEGIIGVLGDGSYALCGIGETVPELVFGQAASDRLEEVWNNNSILREIREGLPRRFEGVCGQCLLKGGCRGFCIARNYYGSRNLWAPFWFCEQAAERGLFPQSRLKEVCLK